MPVATMASMSGALKWSAQLTCAEPAGGGTEVSGIPMYCSHESSTPARFFGTRRKRSKSSQLRMCSQSIPRRLISSATRCGVMSSRKLPRWIGPDGLMPDAQTMVSPGLRSCASAMTSSARRVTQSSGATVSVMDFLQFQAIAYAVRVLGRVRSGRDGGLEREALDDLVAAGADPDGRHARADELLDAQHVGLGVGGQLVERAALGDVLPPAVELLVD